ncbi:hypothetical protein PS704_00219 [Pseudomonas fluorescens]|uniref:Uncharacterized protein n=1 Tax=Pseudomonas fluorescens TaxID=294 RepID=A0A5E6ZVN8_PSEFL|nr:hypothetical protein PS704_00219 [Pseudomonas fluorescens]
MKVVFPLFACQSIYFFKKTPRIIYFCFIPSKSMILVIVAFELCRKIKIWLLQNFVKHLKN